MKIMTNKPKIKPLSPMGYPRPQEQKKKEADREGTQKKASGYTGKIKPLEPVAFRKKNSSVVTLKKVDPSGEGPVETKAQQLYNSFKNWLSESSSNLQHLEFTEIQKVVEDLAGGPYTPDNPPDPAWLPGSINKAVQWIMKER